MTTAPHRLAYSPTEVARLSGLAESTIRRRMDAGLIPELDRQGARRFIPAGWVDSWLHAQVEHPTEAG